MCECVYVCMYVCVCVCVFVCMYACVYGCVNKSFVHSSLIPFFDFEFFKTNFQFQPGTG